MNGPDLKRFTIFQELSEEEREAISEMFEERVLDDGETLFYEGDDAEALVLVSAGTLVLSSSKCAEPGTAAAPAAVGEFSLFGFGVRETCAISQGTTTVMQLRREDFRRFVDDEPRAALRLAEAVLAEISARARAVVGEASR